MAHWVILIIYLNVPHLPQSVGANYDLQSTVVASVFNSSAIWMRDPFVAACSTRLLLPVLPKEKTLSSVWRLAKISKYWNLCVWRFVQTCKITKK